MKTAIVYYSKHHGNTRKLLDAISELGDIELIDAENAAQTNLEGYYMIGFASGIYYSKYHKSVLEFAQQNLPQEKKVFFIHTAGDPRENQNTAIKAITNTKGCRCLGTYCCKGFDTYGPFKLVGGIAKGHPDNEDISGASSFYTSLL